MTISQILYVAVAFVITLYLTNKFLSRGIKLINTSELKKLLDERSADYFYIDVRTPGEFKNNKIKRFKNIPLNTLTKQLDQIPKDRKLVVICQSGTRSSVACRQLKKAGYKELYNVQGGMNLWQG